MHTTAIFFGSILTATTLLFSFEQQPYPVDIAKGDNRKCFVIWTENRTFLDHLHRASKEKHAEAYKNAFKFFRWTLVEDKENPRLKREEITRFVDPKELTVEEKQQIQNSLYRIQKIKPNRFHIYLTALDEKPASYYNEKILKNIKSLNIKS